MTVAEDRFLDAVPRLLKELADSNREVAKEIRLLREAVEKGGQKHDRK